MKSFAKQFVIDVKIGSFSIIVLTSNFFFSLKIIFDREEKAFLYNLTKWWYKKDNSVIKDKVIFNSKN